MQPKSSWPMRKRRSIWAMRSTRWRSGETEMNPMRAELLCELGEAQVKAGDVAEARKTCLRAAEMARRRQPARDVRPRRHAGRPRPKQFRRDRSRPRPAAQRRRWRGWANRTVRCARRRWRGSASSSTGPTGSGRSRYARRPSRWRGGSTIRTRSIVALWGRGICAAKSGQPGAAAGRRARGDRGGRAGAASAISRSRPATTGSPILSKPGDIAGADVEHAGISDRRSGAPGPLQARAAAHRGCAR